MEYFLNEKEFYSQYEKKKKFSLLIILSAAVFAFACLLLSCSTGDFKISLWSAFSGGLSGSEKYVFFNIRLLRALTALSAGAGLAVCGAVMQNVLKNPMASPFTLGISQGAAFGASFAIIFLNAGITSSYGDGVVISSFPLTVVFAFLGAILSGAFVFWVAYLKSGEPHTVILSGIACGAFFQAMTMFIQYFASDVKAAATLFWTFGDISKSTYVSLSIISSFLIAVSFFFIFSALKLNALLWGKEIAGNMGVNVRRFTLISVLAVSALSAVITAFLGVIGFVGLIAPHLAKFAVGHDNRYFLPLSALAGGIVLTLSDIISRVLLAPSVIPVGIITSFWGIAVLIYLLLKRQHAGS